MYHSDLDRLTLGKHYGDALGFRPMNPLVGAVVGLAALNAATNLSMRVIPGGKHLALTIRLRVSKRFVATAARRAAADPSFNRANAKLNPDRLEQKPKVAA